MRVLVAPDSFKECLSAKEAAAAIAAGLRSAVPAVEVDVVPLGDGGEGSAECVSEALGCERIALEVTGPLQTPVSSHFYYNASERSALIESAAACGLALVPVDRRDPERTTSGGVGDLILAALHRGARSLLVMVGGTATVDLGTGMASALGYRFLDGEGNVLPAGGGALGNLAAIHPPASRLWDGVRVVAACDVSNPLLGERGAVRVFAPQKGAGDPATVIRLEGALRHVQELVESQLQIRVGDEVGAGAGGGLGAGLKAFLGAALVPGGALVMDCLGLEEKVRGCDLVITGEGSTDRQSAEGKVCSGVCTVAGKHGVPCVILSGRVEEPLDALRDMGATEIIGISPEGEDASISMAMAASRLTRLAGEVMVRYAGEP